MIWHDIHVNSQDKISKFQMPPWFLKAQIKVFSAAQLQEADEVFEILCQNSDMWHDLENGRFL